MLQDTFDPVPGVVHDLQPGLRRVLAPNPSPMTFTGTNTYIVGEESLAIIDPGPDDMQHLFALLAAVRDRPVTHIFVTHSHIDHSPLAVAVAEETGATIIGFGDRYAGQSKVMRQLSDAGLAGGGEGVDPHFRPDVTLTDGEAIAGQDWAIRAIHTPGHMGNHLCLAWRDALFTGDLVMDWASSLVSPPDGDLTDFLDSCRRLQGVDASVFYPGHGAPVTDPQARLKWLIEHREMRTQQILNSLSAGPASVTALTLQIYDDTPETLLPAASRNVFAHLVHLHENEAVVAHPTLSPNAQFTLTQVR
ncbi:Glyoxylase, beta-lactamase superfamily II [Cognatiyoonia koreensis]|uniref:Glyoxylase, beta-lactamase superfamily II n=1 Tax=Cognatiyoonia koreensis TaxID=364200 RepID=A0A1I0PBQ3_9RHOB|nr:MBL fold metallo-hydrolase [Cognatiyoonia koreensis]SEW11570.1 Glyoxylase, beta-lactamase superfamily II [Cognatiyoonia koreensis]